MAWMIAITAFSIDISLRVLLELGVASPDILLIALVYITLKYPLGEAYILAFLFGFGWDAVFFDPMGLHSFLFVMAVMITARLRQLFWAQYAISRLIMGFFICALIRFGEVIFWLSNLDSTIPILLPQRYIVSGAIITGLLFLFIPWRTKPIFLSRRTPRTLFSERG